MQDTIYFPKFEQFKQFQTINCFNLSPLQAPMEIDDIKDQLLKPTQAPNPEYQKYESRSIKTLVDSFQISFEQNFMEEHKSSFITQMQKYMKLQTSFNQQSVKFNNLYLIHTDKTRMLNLDEMIKEYGTQLTETQRDRLIIDLKREEKLSEFLEFVLNAVDDEHINEVIFIVNEIWQQFILFQDLNYTVEEIVQFSQNFVEKQIKKLYQKVHHINFNPINKQTCHQGEHSLQNQRQKLFKDFLLFFTTTVCLVISGYFQNPYSQSKGLKRESRDLIKYFLDEVQKQYEDSQEDRKQAIISKKIKY